MVGDDLRDGLMQEWALGQSNGIFIIIEHINPSSVGH